MHLLFAEYSSSQYPCLLGLLAASLREGEGGGGLKLNAKEEEAKRFPKVSWESRKRERSENDVILHGRISTVWREPKHRDDPFNIIIANFLKNNTVHSYSVFKRPPLW